jgi:uncharacterized protein YndB with AHSA1/START domain
VSSGTDSVVVTTVVAADAGTTFALFTEDVNLWWKQGPRFRGVGGTLRFEPGEGGRLVQRDTDGSEFEFGRISVWKPGDRLVFGWRNRNFADGELTEVEVQFEAVGSSTRVTVVHRGWDALRPDHPSRHGLEGSAFGAMMGVWWGDQALSLRLWARERSG